MKNIFYTLLFLTISLTVTAQQITYSGINTKEKANFMNFDIIGKVANNYLVIKQNKGINYLQVFDKNMQQLSYTPAAFIPPTAFSISFIAYPNYALGICQYFKGRKVITEAIKLDGDGKKIESKLLDTTLSYNVVYSENKQRIILYSFGYNATGRSVVVTRLYDADANLIEENRSLTKLNLEKEDYDNFIVTNEGAFSFTVTKRNIKASDYVNTVDILLRKPKTSQYVRISVSADKYNFNKPLMKFDNFNNNYFFLSFFYTPDARFPYKLGLFTNVISGNLYKPEKRFIYFTNAFLSRSDTTNPALVFKDFTLQQVLIKGDGSFIAIAENFDGFGITARPSFSPLLSIGKTLMQSGGFGYPSYSNSRYFNQLENVDWDRIDDIYLGKALNNTSKPAENNKKNYGEEFYRYHYNGVAREILIMEISSNLQLKNSNVIRKGQKKADVDYISYGTINLGSKIEFLYIDNPSKRQIVNSRSYSKNGELSNNPTLKSGELGYQFMPRYIKQVDAREALIPTVHKKRIAFAKISF